MRAAMNAPGRPGPSSKYPLTPPPPCRVRVFLSRHYRSSRMSMYMPRVGVLRPPRTAAVPLFSVAFRCSRAPCAGRLGQEKLPALLDVAPDELLGVLLEHLVDLVQDRVHVVGQLL